MGKIRFQIKAHPPPPRLTRQKLTLAPPPHLLIILRSNPLPCFLPYWFPHTYQEPIICSYLVYVVDVFLASGTKSASNDSSTYEFSISESLDPVDVSSSIELFKTSLSSSSLGMKCLQHSSKVIKRGLLTFHI